MKRKIWMPILALGLISGFCQAGANTDAILGGALGGAAGAAVGSAVGGRDGAIIGSAVGGAAGVAVATSDRGPRHGYYRPHPPYHHRHHHWRGPYRD